MSTPAFKRQTASDAHIDECVATQPVSGVKIVHEAYACNGFSMGNYVHVVKVESKQAKAS